MSTTRETKELTTVDARRELTKLPEKLGANPATVAVTRRGKPVLAIMTWEDYQAILESLEILSDGKAVEQLRRSIQEVREGKTIPWKDAKARLGGDDNKY
jgi:PHD/YefM family antitoxin component YafN of YafNO toxin-antitoxin module